MMPSLCTLNVMTTCPFIDIAAYGNQPVALDLRDEAANPRTELDALGVELNRRTELAAAALRVVELIALHVALEVAERVAERSARRRAATVRAGLRRDGRVGNCSADCDSGDFDRAWLRSALGAGCVLAAARPTGSGSAPGLARARAARLARRARTCCRAKTAAGSSASAHARAIAPGDPGPTARPRGGGFGAVRSTRGCTKTKRWLIAASRCCLRGEHPRRLGVEVLGKQPRRQEQQDDHAAGAR